MNLEEFLTKLMKFTRLMKMVAHQTRGGSKVHRLVTISQGCDFDGVNISKCQVILHPCVHVLIYTRSSVSD